MARYGHGLTPLSRFVSAPAGTASPAPADAPQPAPPPPQTDAEKVAIAEQILAAGRKARTPTGTPESAATDNERPHVEMFGASAGGPGPRPTAQGMTAAEKKALGEEIARQGRRRRGEPEL